MLCGHVIAKTLGSGAYGTVYLAKKKNADQYVAIKSIPRSKLNKRAADNLISEITIFKSLRHPNVVRMLDFSWDSDCVYLFMEYCAGGDLGKFIRSRKRLPEDGVRYFLKQLALALQYLHKRNIIHMDLKPQNILLTSANNPTLKVTDFGFAQCHKDSVQMNELRGTLLYMAPEVYAAGIYHPSCDLWSVGVIVYECIFGAPPYASPIVDELRQKLLRGEPIVLPTSVPISTECASLLKGLLKHNPKERMDHEAFFHHPFVDLQSAIAIENVYKAIDYLEDAFHLEVSGQLEAAHNNYVEGLAQLLEAIEHESSVRKKRELRSLAAVYFTKAERVKTQLDRTEVPCRPPPIPDSKPNVSSSRTHKYKIAVVKDNRGLIKNLVNKFRHHNEATNEPIALPEAKPGRAIRVTPTPFDQSEPDDNKYVYPRSTDLSYSNEEEHSDKISTSATEAFESLNNKVEAEELIDLSQTEPNTDQSNAALSRLRALTLDRESEDPIVPSKVCVLASQRTREPESDSQLPDDVVRRMKVLESLCSSADRSKHNLVSALGTFYRLIHQHRSAAALAYFDQHFMDFLELVKVDSNDTRKNAFLKELTNALRLVEKMRSKSRSPPADASTSNTCVTQQTSENSDSSLVTPGCITS